VDCCADRQGAYRIDAHPPGQVRYAGLDKADKDLVRSFPAKVSGFSRAQFTRSDAHYLDTGQWRDLRGPSKDPAQSSGPDSLQVLG